MGEPSATSLNIAVEGCCHGELDLIYERLDAHEKQTGQKVDLLICCGDFQSHRNPADFHSSSIPPKYRRLGTFPKYYSGEKTAPILTLFIGGNHEASQPLRELYYGGWAAPNIYYMGAAGVVQYGGIRIGGMSGIYKSHDYKMGHFERPPFDNSSLRSVYHVRNVDIYRMKCLSKCDSRVDVIASHDWPLGIEQHGNTEELLRKKPYFRAEVERNDLGSPPSREVLDVVQPKWWFAAHLHVKFLATVKHQSGDSKTVADTATIAAQLIPSQVMTKEAKSPSKATQQPIIEESSNMTNSDDRAVDDPPGDTAATNDDTKKTEFHGLESTCSVEPDLTDLMTKFLALDKCLPRRQYLSILHIERESSSKEDLRLEFDPEWLAILRKTHKLNCTERKRVDIPEALEEITKDEIQWVVDRLKEKNSQDGQNGFFTIPTCFQPTVPLYSDPLFRSGARCPPLPVMGNPQTDYLLDLLELDHILTVPFDSALTPENISTSLGGFHGHPGAVAADENEIDIDMDEGSGAEDEAKEADIVDENEIGIDEDEEEDGDGDTPEESGGVAHVDPVESVDDTAPTKKARIDD